MANLTHFYRHNILHQHEDLLTFIFYDYLNVLHGMFLLQEERGVSAGEPYEEIMQIPHAHTVRRGDGNHQP